MLVYQRFDLLLRDLWFLRNELVILQVIVEPYKLILSCCFFLLISTTGGTKKEHSRCFPNRPSWPNTPKSWKWMTRNLNGHKHPVQLLKKTLKKPWYHMFIHVPFILFFPETEFSGSDRWGILQFQFTARCSADAVHVPEAERRPQGRKILPEPPGPSRRRCESLALPMALGVRLPEEWIHMMVWSKNNRARYGAPVFFGVWFEERIMKIKNPI